MKSDSVTFLLSLPLSFWTHREDVNMGKGNAHETKSDRFKRSSSPFRIRMNEWMGWAFFWAWRWKTMCAMCANSAVSSPLASAVSDRATMEMQTARAESSGFPSLFSPMCVSIQLFPPLSRGIMREKLIATALCTVHTSTFIGASVRPSNGDRYRVVVLTYWTATI